MQIAICNFELALGDTRMASNLDPMNMKAAYRHALTAQRLGRWEECCLISEQGLHQQEWRAAHSRIRQILSDAGNHQGLQLSRSCPPRLPTVKFGGPRRGQTDTEFLQEQSNLMIAVMLG